MTAWNSAQMTARPAAKLDNPFQPNDHPEVGARFPCMLYKATTEEKRSMQTDANAKCGETWTVDNKFDGLLCDTIVAHDQDEAEILAENGWDSSPKAAHGMAEGIVAATSAKDAEIAALRAALADKMAQEEVGSIAAIKRGPGRPKVVTAEDL